MALEEVDGGPRGVGGRSQGDLEPWDGGCDPMTWVWPWESPVKVGVAMEEWAWYWKSGCGHDEVGAVLKHWVWGLGEWTWPWKSGCGLGEWAWPWKSGCGP